MKQYFKNLLSALLGNNPYQTERDELRRQLEQAAENMEQLRNMYCAACEKWEQGDKQVASLQQLVENLRERIADKDAVIAQLQKEYREYTKQAKETTNKS
jgi:chromosome segregation ATPase